MIDVGRAERVRRFAHNIKATMGSKAGQPFDLFPWQWNDVILPLFGTVKGDGLRQYRFCYVEIPKKNGKTPLSAVIGLYMLCADREQSPEVYLAAADREQAGYIYRYASQMVAESPTLTKVCKVLDSRKRIVNHSNGGFLQAVSAESYTKHGINPSCVLFDELHAQPNDELWTTLTSGTDYARKQQIVFCMSTAGIFDKESIWWRTREKARQIRDGIIEQSNFLPVLYIADPEKDDPEDEELWKRVNPSLGHIFTLDKIREDFEQAKKDPVEYQNFLRFRLNIPVKHTTRWMPMSDWDKCGGAVDIEALKGRRCFGGLDLSSKLDLTAFVLVFPPIEDDEPIKIIAKFYCPEDTIIKRGRQDSVHYDIWAKQGWLTATPGNVIDEAFIERDMIQASKDYQVIECAFDPWGAASLSTRLFNDNGIVMVETRQGHKSMSEPAKRILTDVMSHKIAHGKNPILRWCMDNLVMRMDANENVAPDKEHATERIDGAVALIMAYSRSMFGEDQTSVYEERGVLFG